MGDAEHRAGHEALQGGRAVGGPHQAPVWFVVTALQDLHRLPSPHRQLVAVAGHKVVDDYSQLTATGELDKTGKTSRRLHRYLPHISDGSRGFESHTCRKSAYRAAICDPCGSSHLVAVQRVLGSAGCQRDGIWLAAAFTLTVQVLSIPNMKNRTFRCSSEWE